MYIYIYIYIYIYKSVSIYMQAPKTVTACVFLKCIVCYYRLQRQIHLSPHAQGTRPRSHRSWWVELAQKCCCVTKCMSETTIIHLFSIQNYVYITYSTHNKETHGMLALALFCLGGLYSHKCAVVFIHIYRVVHMFIRISTCICIYTRTCIYVYIYTRARQHDTWKQIHI